MTKRDRNARMHGPSSSTHPLTGCVPGQYRAACDAAVPGFICRARADRCLLRPPRLGGASEDGSSQGTPRAHHAGVTATCRAGGWGMQDWERVLDGVGVCAVYQLSGSRQIHDAVHRNAGFAMLRLRGQAGQRGMGFKGGSFKTQLCVALQYRLQ